MPSVGSVTKGGVVRPPIALLYAVHKIGKTTFGANAPNPVFIQTEDGLGMLDPPTLGMHTTFDMVMESIGSLYNDEHNFQTVVLDSVDHLEPLVWKQTCKDNGWANIETPGYGRGPLAALDNWKVLLEGFAALRNDRKMTVLLLAHSAILKFNAPDTAPYDRYVPKLQRDVSALIEETMDAILFANYRVSTVEADQGFGKKVTRAVGGAERMLYTEERPSHKAGNRYGMPYSLPLSWDAVAEHIPYFNKGA